MASKNHDWLEEYWNIEYKEKYPGELEDNRKLNEIERRLTREEAWRQGRAEGWAEGTKKGKREAVQHLLSLRSIELTPSDHDALMACNDITTLEKLLERALVMQSGEALFEDES